MERPLARCPARLAPDTSSLLRESPQHLGPALTESRSQRRPSRESARAPARPQFLPPPGARATPPPWQKPGGKNPVADHLLRRSQSCSPGCHSGREAGSDHAGLDEAVRFGKVVLPIRRGEWNTVLVEIKGGEMRVIVAGKSIAAGTAACLSLSISSRLHPLSGR